jgi:hypothetical protein
VLADQAAGDGGGGDLGGHAAGPLRLQRVRLPAHLRLFAFASSHCPPPPENICFIGSRAYIECI